MQYPRTNPMPGGPYALSNPDLANQVSGNPVFASMMAELKDMRERQKLRWQYVYGFADDIAPNTTLPFTITIESGTDFRSKWLTMSAFNYDATNASIFPMPNSAGSTAWSGRGLSVAIHDESSGRDITSGYIPYELLATPGFGLNFQYPYPFNYHFQRNTQIRFDVRNRETNAARNDMQFAIALLGEKLLSPA